MTRYTTTSSKPCNSVSPRPQSGMSREYVHGPLQPMGEERDAHPLAWLALLAGLCILVALFAAILP